MVTTYSIKVGQNEPVFVDTDDPIEQVVENILEELYGEKEVRYYGEESRT